MQTIISSDSIDMRAKILSKCDEKELQKASLDHIHIGGRPPPIVLIVGPCRTGTTALSNVLIRSGLHGYMQPIKSMRRAIEEGDIPVDFSVEDGHAPIISKETLGAKTAAEFFDPLKTLIAAGYPKESIHLIGMMREPRATLGSWVKMWGKILFDGFTKSFNMTQEIMDNAEGSGIASITHYVHEAISTAPPAVVIGKLLDRLEGYGCEVRDRSDRAVDWREGSVFGDQNKAVTFFDKPPDKFIEGVRTYGGYQYRSLIPNLSPLHDAALRSEGLYSKYNEFASKCERDLGLDILE